MNDTPETDRSAALATTLTVLVVSCMTVMANATIAPSLPGLAAAFGDIPRIETLSGLVLSTPSIAIVLTAGIFGWLTDRVDRRTLLVAALLIYAIGGASGLYLDSLPQILVGRAILGIGVGGIMTVATMLAGELWSGRARAAFMGRQSAAMSAGGIVFILAGGLLAEISWRGPFAIYLVTLPVALLAWRMIPRAKTVGQSDATRRAPLDLAAVGPIVVLAFFTMLMFYIIPTRLPFLMADMGITSPSATGAAISTMTVAGFFAALRFPALRDRFSPWAICAIGFVFLGVGYVVISMAAGIWGIVAGCFVSGLGLGTIMPNQNNWLMSVVPDAARGRASGLMTTAIFAGQFLSPLVAGLVGMTVLPETVFLAFAAALGLAALAVMATSLRHRTAMP